MFATFGFHPDVSYIQLEPILPPAGTTQAQMQLITNQITGAVYVDDLVFQ